MDFTKEQQDSFLSKITVPEAIALRLSNFRKFLGDLPDSPVKQRFAALIAEENPKLLFGGICFLWMGFSRGGQVKITRSLVEKILEDTCQETMKCPASAVLVSQDLKKLVDYLEMFTSIVDDQFRDSKKI